jgi:hypothetical protein
MESKAPVLSRTSTYFLCKRMSSELGAVEFIFGERGKVDEADGFIGGSGEIGRHEISENLAAAFAYGNLLVGGVFRDVRQLVGVNRVTQKKCDQGKCLQAQFSIRPPPIVRRDRSIRLVWADNASMNEKLSITANLLGDPGRAAILLRLMSGLALPAGSWR